MASFFQRLKDNLNPFDGSNKNPITNNSLTRGFSRVVDQVNLLDSGRSWKTRTPSAAQAQQSAVSQAGRIAAPSVGKFLNTAAAIPGEIYGTARVVAATQSNNPTAMRNANDWQKNYQQVAYNPTGGLFGVGTFFKSPEEASRGDFATVAKRIGGGTLGTAAEVLPMARGGSFALRGMGAKQAVPRMIAENTLYGATGSAGNQLVQNGKVDVKQLAKDTLAANALGAGMYGVGKAAGKSVEIARKPEVKAAAKKAFTGLDAATQKLRDEYALSYTIAMDKGDKITAADFARKIDKIDRMSQGGYAKNPFGKEAATGLSKEQSSLVNDYAEMLQDMETNGVSLLPDGEGGKVRQSANGQFYRQVYDEKGRPPTKEEWFNEARRQIESGQAGFGASEEYAKLPTATAPQVGKTDRTQLTGRQLQLLDVPDRKLSTIDPEAGIERMKDMPLDRSDEGTFAMPIQVNPKQRGGAKQIKVERIPVNIKAIDPSKVQDIGRLSAQFADLWRNTESVFGKNSPVGDTILRPLENAKSRFIEDQNAMAGSLKRTIVDGLGIKKGSKMSAAVQEFGEGKKSYGDLVEIFGKEKAEKVVRADKWFRGAYDQVLAEVNEQRMRIYNGNRDKLIPRRQDYYRHFRELQDGFQGLLNIFDSPSGISSQLAGISERTKPKSKWLSFAQRRKGDATDVDAVGGFLDYLRASSYAKNIDPEIARIRKFRDSLAEQTAEGTEAAGKLNTYLEFLDDYANDLAGKTNPADRFVQKLTGRKTFSVLNWLNRRAKSNAILGNAASSIAQVFNLPAGLADIQDSRAVYAGAKDFFKHISGAKTAITKSKFIKERYNNTFDQFDTKLLDKGKQFSAWMVGVGDELATKYIWHAQFNKAVKSGLNEAESIRFADNRTRAVVAGRGVGETPILQKSQMFQVVAPFQLEVANQWLVARDMWRGGAKTFSKGVIVYSLAAAMMNKAAEQVRGNDVVFDPLDALADAWNEMTEESDATAKERAQKAAGRLGGEVLSNIPGGAYAATALVNDPFKRKEYFGNEDPTRFGTQPLVLSGTVGAGLDIADRPTDWRSYSKAATGLLTPYAGKQIDRTINAAADLNRGYTTSRSGDPKFAAEEDPIRIAQALLFGSNSTPTARNYYANNMRPLEGKQAELIAGLPRSEVRQNIADIQAQRLENRQVEKQKETAKNTDKDVQQLNDGTFYGKIGNQYRTFETKEDYDQGKAEYEFKQSSEKSKIIGDTYFYRTKSGKVQSKPLAEYEFDKSMQGVSISLDKAKAANDLNSWTEAADKKYQALIKKRDSYDPETEFDKIDTIDKQLLDLEQEASKYISRGYITKGKSGGGRKISVAKGGGTANIAKDIADVKRQSVRSVRINPNNIVAKSRVQIKKKK